VQISYGQIREEISLEAKIGLQIFSRGVTQRNLSADCQQDWTMENCQKRHAHSKRRHCATPWSARLRLCLTVFGHYGDCISTLTKKKGQMTQSAFAVCWFLSANRNCLWQIRRAMRFERPPKNSFHPRKKLQVSSSNVEPIIPFNETNRKL